MTTTALRHTADDRALLLADVVDSTRLGERLGDAHTIELWAAHDRAARALLARLGGREIDRADGFFLIFATAAEAARFALGYHDELASLGVQARIGIHVGPVVLRENPADEVARGAKLLEVEGRSKPVAARIMALAPGGRTLLSAEARAGLHAFGDGTEIESHGHYRLKGIEAPVEIFELGLRGRVAFAPPPDVDKAYRVARNGDLWRPVREVRHNLGRERDAFVGRVAALRALSQRLDAEARLLTMLGPAGTGKTRLIRRYALAWLGDWPGGVYFCDLSEARTLDGICYAVGIGLDVPLGREPVSRLGHAIAGRGRCLVILDNFEQVVPHAAATVGRWVDRAPDATFVVTSRERLHLPGEEVFAVGPLDLESESIELFIARARSQSDGFALDDASRAAVAEVVRLLDGLPLAIELAAARTSLLSPAQLVERMRDRFRILAGVRGAGARQATLRAALDWSWDLLAPWEQAALAQCSVFDGGFFLEAAEAVLDLSTWPEAPPALDAVQALVDKSLVRVGRPLDQRRLELDEPWFGMYLSIHDYAVQRLGAMEPMAGEAARARHARHYATFGSEVALDALSRHGGLRLRRKLTLDLDNLLAACRWAIERRAAGTALGSYRAVWQVLELQGPFALALALGGAVVDVTEPGSLLSAQALVTRAGVARLAGRIEVASEWLQTALELARRAGDRRIEAAAVTGLGVLYSGTGDEREIGCKQQALELHRELGDRVSEGTVLSHLGSAFADRGRMTEAQQAYEAALALHRETGNRRAEGQVLDHLGTVFTDVGPVSKAHGYFEAALEIAREVGARHDEGIVLGNLATLHATENRIEEALICTGEAITASRELGDRRSEAIAIGNRGDLHDSLGNGAQARADLEIALSISREIGHRRHEGAMLASLARTLTEMGFESEGASALKEAESLLRTIGDPYQLAGVLCLRGHAELKAGQRESAMETLAETQRLADGLGLGADSALGKDVSRLRAGLAI